MAATIALQRLYNQRLEGQKLRSPTEVVAWFGAVQAQEYALAKWALAQRLPPGVTDAEIEQVFNDGAILRTHAMRPTWHFLTPADIRWVLELTAPRVHQINAHMYRQLELDADLLRRSDDMIARALIGGKHLTRKELGMILTEAGIDTFDGMRLGYIVHHAELERVVCSGPRRGKQFTYALLDERAPNARSLPRDEALAELTRRFFTSHGPAMVNDFAWWSGLTVADARAGLNMLQPEIVSEEIDGKTYWRPAAMPPVSQRSPVAHLLPVYDEYGIAYKDHRDMLDSAFAEHMRNNIRFFSSAYIVDGRIAGMWRRTTSKNTVVIETLPFRTLDTSEIAALNAAAQRYGDFLGLTVDLRFGEVQ